MSKKYILAVETLTKSGSLSLFSEDMNEIDFYVGGKDNKLSADLIDMISNLLNRNEVMLPQISKIIIANGPGSFTGLRVGWSAVKALAKSLAIPFFTVSILDALLEQKLVDVYPDFAFISIGAGKIACKQKGDKFTKSFLFDEFLQESAKNYDKSYVTIKDFNFPTKENIYYASDNVSSLIGISFKKGIIAEKTLNYFIL
jgi:tRNA threonylcarbamoyl adenosine modification protein YeaZ